MTTTTTMIESLECRRMFAGVLRAGFTESAVAAGLDQPTAMAFAPDGRIFVTEQGGTVRVVKNGGLLGTPFLTKTVNSESERGMLGIAFDPQFATNNFVYVYYTATTPNIHNRVSRFTANGDVVVPNSERIIFELPRLSAGNHNGGAIHFGADGKLYIATGENAVPSNAQSKSTTLGKILRINRNGSIPTDNPFFNTTTGRNRAIYALGLRNPYTFAFRPGTSRFFINDVGQNTFEEINTSFKGANYGWPAFEGKENNPRFRPPIHAYPTGDGCAITGGAFYDPPTANFPEAFEGRYFFADYCGGFIKFIHPGLKTVGTLAKDLQNVVDLQVGPDGALYYLDRHDFTDGNGVVGRITNAAGGAKPAEKAPAAKAAAKVAETIIVGSAAAANAASDRLAAFVAWSTEQIDGALL
jgi:glucose/arabinose dehydrogenase